MLAINSILEKQCIWYFWFSILTFLNIPSFFQIDYVVFYINLARWYGCDRLEETRLMIPLWASKFTNLRIMVLLYLQEAGGRRRRTCRSSTNDAQPIVLFWFVRLSCVTYACLDLDSWYSLTLDPLDLPACIDVRDPTRVVFLIFFILQFF